MGYKAINKRSSFSGMLLYGKSVFMMLFMCTPGFAQKASLVVQTGHFKDMVSLAWSPDSRLIASGGKDNSLLLYDATTALEMASFTLFEGWVSQVGFTKDSKRVMGHSKGEKEGC